MALVDKINQHLNKYPGLKKHIKRIYQRVNYTLSNKFTSEGNIVRLSPNDPAHEYFFGYYDKTPWDATGRYVLCLKTKNTWNSVAPAEPAEIILIDTEKSETDPDRVKKLAVTHTWNVQQGCMLQWLGPDYDREIIFNDFRNGKFCSVILDIFTGVERVLSVPVYSVSGDGRFALTLDFSRLHRMRPGYGYSNLPDKTEGEKVPNGPCIWKLDIVSDTVTTLLNYSDFADFEHRPEMEGAEHKVNHIMVSPDGRRFMVLHRWFRGGRKYTRLVTVNVDGFEMYNLSDDDMVSHCTWKNNRTILAFENKSKTGAGYYLMTDKTEEYKHLWPHITGDGHPSYSPDGRLVVTDTYPNRKRIAHIKVMNEDMNIVVARVFSPFKYDNDTRCDLHPRWSRDGKKICFDSVFEGHRGLYYVDLSEVKVAYSETVGQALRKTTSQKRIRVVYLMTACKRSGPSQQTLNVIKYLDAEKFEPILITLYDEEKNGVMAEFLPHVDAHYFVKTSKTNIMLKQGGALRRKLEELEPDVIHTLGVFPDYAVCRFHKFNQVLTIHAFGPGDFPAKFGKINGVVLSKIHLYALKHATKAIACSESLSNIYRENLHLNFEFIRNGVDVDKYSMAKKGEKKAIREELSLPLDKFIFVYTGQFIERKNIPFLLEAFTEQFGHDQYLLMLGGGPELGVLREKYREFKNIDFRGNVSNVDHYLKACDCYVLTSKLEGLPCSVLEAMAVGLPVILSDIMPHVEIFDVSGGVGYLYKEGNRNQLMKKLEMMLLDGGVDMGKRAFDSSRRVFCSKKMSEMYQTVYEQIVNRQQS